MESPTAWSSRNKSHHLSVDGIRVYYKGPDRDWSNFAFSGLVLANNPIPPCELFYFEVKIINAGKNGIIGVGFCAETVNLNVMPGWGDSSWGYRGDIGKSFCCSEGGQPYGPLFTTGDIIGCCINFRCNNVFYTKNGVNLGIAFQNFKLANKMKNIALYPCVGLRSLGGSVEVNFGHQEFKYEAITFGDIKDELLKEKWVKSFNQYRMDEFIDLVKLLEVNQDITLFSKYKGYCGKAYFFIGQYEKAIESLTESLKTESNNVFALRYRAETYKIINKYKESLADLERLLEIVPNHAWALRAREEITRHHLIRRGKERLRFFMEQKNMDLEQLMELERLERGFFQEPERSRQRAIDAAVVAGFSFMEDLRIRESAARFSGYGKCSHCDEDNTFPVWCQTCDPNETTQGWTSGDKAIDDFIKKFQLKTIAYEEVIEWIPFDRLTKIEKIGKGGFGTVFSAIWLDGVRKVEYKNEKYRRTREKSCKVALKTLSPETGSSDFLKEFKNHLECRMKGTGLEIYGLTSKDNKYMMVFQYANEGNLHQCLQSKFKQLTWENKLQLLINILYDLVRIHDAGYVHNDFHSGNILQKQHISGNMESYITDLGLSKKKDESIPEGTIFGVMPYVAPEVLSGHQHTQMADIYGLGIIMIELSTGKRPFDGYEFNTKLAMNIIKGLRPELSSVVPNRYNELVEQCIDSDPQKRPTAKDIFSEIYQWQNIVKSNNLPNEDLEIKKEFIAANRQINTLSVTPIHRDSMYTSKLINTRKINNLIDSVQFELTITDSMEGYQLSSSPTS